MSTGNELARLIIYGTPRTKKTKNEIHLTVHKFKLRAWVSQLAHVPDALLMRQILQRVKVQPGKLYRQWYKDAVVAWQVRPPTLPITSLVSIKADIYRPRAIGDVHGFQQAIGDYLEGHGILKDDKLIEHWDGTRRLKDTAVPRVELTIREECST